MATKPSDVTVRNRVLRAIRIEQGIAERKIFETRASLRKQVYAPLFENALRFWRDLHYCVESGETPASPQQAAVLEILRKNAEKGAGK